ncbi:uncharacterized protein L969DRAFT_613205 [Mixia osmundae IAM 14324]|uniref:Elongator complex protein 2 n=1 Tax=Mixia osmundae (strain CBS 9802 / IAM 14324 / JCM 22182 / KY 12970) TaxID=764103 RepID=G7DVG4_MIXOS|nr:uncharacterized protein L969DRAFT_613205 [Mixia osmundae IAM 14324]KEI36372.1 hypothetical protein L969DRAFT_613205 [Mixia osmundae IAM 14324]GAA94574.1 hypothetical protein E5Q_01226 [Mixia osmundae IAM 14324]
MSLSSSSSRRARAGQQSQQIHTPSTYTWAMATLASRARQYRQSRKLIEQDELLREVVFTLQGADTVHVKFDDSTLPSKAGKRPGRPFSGHKDGIGGYGGLGDDDDDGLSDTELPLDGGITFVSHKDRKISAPNAAVLHRLAELGYLYRSITKALAESQERTERFQNDATGLEAEHSRTESRPGGLIEQGLCHALQAHIGQYQSNIAALEAQINANVDSPLFEFSAPTDPPDVRSETSDVVTLKGLLARTDSLVLKTRLMKLFIDAAQEKRGSDLLTFIQSYTTGGDPFIANFAATFLADVTRPFFRMLQKWIYSGILSDPFGEFFIQQLGIQPTEKAHRGQSSTARLVFREDRVPSFMTIDLARKIFSTGKSLFFLRLSCTDDDALLPAPQAGDEITYANLSRLDAQVATAYESASRRLFTIFCERFRLPDHLRALKNYILLGRGDFVELLMESLGASLDKAAGSLYRHTLTATLEAALQGSTAVNDSPETLKRLDVDMVDTTRSVIGWNAFVLKYRVSPPIDTILSPGVMQQYTRIFTHFWKIKRVEYSTNMIWTKLVSNAKALSRVTQLRNDFHKARLAVAEMIHYIRQLQYYNHLEVVECSWQQLTEFVHRQEGDLDSLVAAHQTYLDRLYNKALLQVTQRPTSKLAPNPNALLKMVEDSFLPILAWRDNAEALCEWAMREANWEVSQGDHARGVATLPVQRPSEGDLATYRRRLDRYCLVFSNAVSGLVASLQAQPDSELRLLAIRIDHNKFYRKTSRNWHFAFAVVPLVVHLTPPMLELRPTYIAAACNRFSGAAEINASGEVAFGSGKLLALWNAQDEHHAGVHHALLGHNAEVTQVCSLGDGWLSGDASGALLVWQQPSKAEASTSNGWTAFPVLPSRGSSVCTLASLMLSDDIWLALAAHSDGSASVLSFTLKKGERLAHELVQEIKLGDNLALSAVIGTLPNGAGLLLALACTDNRIHLLTRPMTQGAQFVPSTKLEGHKDWTRCLCTTVATTSAGDVRPGDVLLASGSQDHYIRIWKISPARMQTVKTSLLDDADLDEEDGQQRLSMKSRLLHVAESGSRFTCTSEAVLFAHEDWVIGLHFSHVAAASYGQLPELLSASADRSMILWRFDQRSSLWTNVTRFGEMSGTNLGFFGALWSADGLAVLAHGWTGSFHVWRRQTSAEQSWQSGVGVSGHFRAITSLAWEPQGQFLLTTSLDHTTRLHGPWRRNVDGAAIETWHELARPQVHGHAILTLNMLSGLSFLSGSDEKVVRVFDAPQPFLDSMRKLGTVQSFSGPTQARQKGVTLPPLGLSNKASTDDVVEPVLRDAPPLEEDLLTTTLWPEIEKVYGHGYEIATTALSHDGRLLATACKANSAKHAGVRLYDTSTWASVEPVLDGHELTILDMAFSPDDTKLVTTSRDRTWRLYQKNDKGQFSLQAVGTTHTRIVRACVWSKDGTLFATASRDKTVKIWSSETAQLVESIRLAQAPCAIAVWPNAISFALAIGCEDGSCHFFDRGSQTLQLKEGTAAGPISMLAFSLEGTRLASCSEDGIVRIYTVRSLQST